MEDVAATLITIILTLTLMGGVVKYEGIKSDTFKKMQADVELTDILVEENYGTDIDRERVSGAEVFNYFMKSLKKNEMNSQVVLNDGNTVNSTDFINEYRGATDDAERYKVMTKYREMIIPKQTLNGQPYAKTPRLYNVQHVKHPVRTDLIVLKKFVEIAEADY